MGFTTTTFLYAFLPLSLGAYYLFYKGMRNKENFVIGNIILILFSIVFYSWALAASALFLLLDAGIVFLFGLFINRLRRITVSIPYTVDQEKRTTEFHVAIIPTLVGIVAAVYLLYHFKYASTIAGFLSDYFYVDTNRYTNITVPLGISFITFSIISYFVDIYQGNATAGNLFDCLLYIFFFPKVVSGPIILWRDFQPQIKTRPVSTSEFVQGINRLIIGFAKKVILADTFGAFINNINGQNIDAGTAWLSWICYALEIYYDFSGYSDIAIGVSEMVGFHFAENFNFPYRSLSITEFWRRWHISLGNFFKNYIYFPLGGNRKGKNRTLVNLAVVFAVTGIWHGAGAAYIIWGAIHGCCVVIERVIRDKEWYKKIPSFFKWIVTFIISATAWQLFRFGSLRNTATWFFSLFGKYDYSLIPMTWEYYLDARLITFIVIGFIGATLLGNQKLKDFYKAMNGKAWFYILKEAVLIILLLVSVAFMINSTYSPFIYFQF